MKTSIETRELITLHGLGVSLRGTYHPARHKGLGTQSEDSARGRTGILFLSILLYPRTATGDSAVYWAESYAEIGYPSFRLDLPGLGDSEGDTPTPLVDFINAGGYAAVLAASVSELVERFGLSGVVIVGHCAGAVSAIYTAAMSKHCKGLLLLDPYFHLPQAIRPNIRQRLIGWASRNHLGGLFRKAFHWLREIRLLFLKDSPPGNANFPLINHWKQIASTGIPILLLKAFNTKPRLGDFDYLTYIQDLAGRKSQIVLDTIECTDHSFANRAGRAAVRLLAENWLQTHFPRAISGEPTLDPSHRTEDTTTISEANSMASIPMNQTGGGN